MTDCPIGFEGIDMDDPRQNLAWALGSMPSHQKNGMPVPIPPKAIPNWSQFLNDLGLEFNPAKQKLFPIASEQPGMGWLSPVRWVSREEYDKHQAEKRAAEQDLAEALATATPGLVQALADMADVDKRNAMASQAAKFHATFARIQQMSSGQDNAAATEEDTAP